MKNIGIIGAMSEEIALLKEKADIISSKEMVGLKFHIGKMHGKSVVLVCSGIGKVNAAVCTQALIDMYGVDYLINVGVAGALARELNIGDIVISTDVVQHDMDCVGFGYEPGIIPRLGCSFFEADSELLRIAKEACEAVTDKKAYLARIASGDRFVSDSATKSRIWNTFKAYCVEMEGAAVAQTAWLNKIPFVIIRAISDKANEEATMAFDKFVEIAAKNSSSVVEEMVKAI